MIHVSMARRALVCSGVVGVYTVIDNYQPFKIFEVNDAHAQNLKNFRKNIAEEAAELLGKINQNLYGELEKIHKQSNSPDDLETWAQKLEGKDVPPRLISAKKHSGINDQLRVVPLEDQEISIQLGKQSHKFMHNSEKALKNLLNEYYDLENEVILVFTNKQKQVSKLMESYRTKLFINQQSSVDNICIFQYISCLGFSVAVRMLWPLSAADLASHQNKLPRFGKLITVALLGVAYVVSDAEKERKDYDVVTAYEEADVPLPPFLRLPPQAPAPCPHVYLPGQTCEDHFPLPYIRSNLFKAFTDGWIFRQLLFGSLMSFSSLRSSHLLTAAAATLAGGLQDSEDEGYHEVTGSEQGGEYQASDALTHSFSFPFSLKPLLLQAILFTSGRFYLTVAVDVLMRLQELMIDARDDEIFHVMYRTSDVYDVACRVSAFFDTVTTSVVRWIDTFKGASPTRYDKIADEIVEHYLKMLQKSGEGEYFTTEEMISLEKATMFSFETLHLPLKALLPEPFNPQARRRRLQHGPEESLMLQSISGLDNDLLARASAFLQDSERHYINNDFGGKIGRNDASALLQMCIISKWWLNGSPEDMASEVVRRVMFWDVDATEENVLDLLQEYYEFIMAKKLLFVEIFVAVHGRSLMLDQECEPRVDKALLEAYYRQLDSWLRCAMELEEINFLNRYGLTTSRLQSVVARRSSTRDLAEKWDAYFANSEYREMLKKKADPVAKFRKG